MLRRPSLAVISFLACGVMSCANLDKRKTTHGEAHVHLDRFLSTKIVQSIREVPLQPPCRASLSSAATDSTMAFQPFQTGGSAKVLYATLMGDGTSCVGVADAKTGALDARFSRPSDAVTFGNAVAILPQAGGLDSFVVAGASPSRQMGLYYFAGSDGDSVRSLRLPEKAGTSDLGGVDYKVAAVADSDNDGVGELLFASAQGAPCVRVQRFSGRTGSLLSELDMPCLNGKCDACSGLIDVSLELATLPATRGEAGAEVILVIRHAGGASVFGIRGDVVVFAWQHPDDSPMHDESLFGFGMSIAPVSDLNGDQKIDFLILAYKEIWAFDGASGVLLRRIPNSLAFHHVFGIDHSSPQVGAKIFGIAHDSESKRSILAVLSGSGVTIASELVDLDIDPRYVGALTLERGAVVVGTAGNRRTGASLVQVLLREHWTLFDSTFGVGP